MSIAQQLYEGIDLGSMGSLGLITYMRTDSTHLSGEALGEVRNYIQGHFGPKYLPEKPNFYAAGKSAQQAHEAIRPTDVDLTPPDIKQYLNEEQYKLYDLVWRRFVSCQMEPARWNVTTLSITTPTSLGPATYKAAGRVLVFDGYSKVWPVTSTEQQLPPTQKGQPLATVDIRPEQHFNKPPARYTEASLVKALEKEGIGRPSTYAPIISTIQDREYVEQKDRKFYATDLGEVVTDKLNEFFPRSWTLPSPGRWRSSSIRSGTSISTGSGSCETSTDRSSRTSRRLTKRWSTRGRPCPASTPVPTAAGARLPVRQEPPPVPSCSELPDLQIRLALRQRRQDGPGRGH
jgi:DNA topoisomerase-1